jgi:formate/nitrite transporter FocA (FNT family)
MKEAMPQNNPARAEKKTAGSTVTLSPREKEDVKKRLPPRAAVIFETIRQEGSEELERPTLSLSASGLAAGLTMGFSFVVMALLQSMLPDAPWRPLVVNFGYTVGFVIVILGRQQLFTENTVTVILPLLDSKTKLLMLGKVGRLWGIVLAANLVGAAIFAFAMAHLDIFPGGVRDAMKSIGTESFAPGFVSILLRGVFAGWLLALMVWVLPGAEVIGPLIIVFITYVVGLGSFSHAIAGSIETMYLVAIGQISIFAYLGSFLVPVLIGNIIGGVSFVSLLNYGQVVAEG